MWKLFLIQMMLPIVAHARFTNMEMVPAPGSLPVALKDQLAMEESVQYSDPKMRLTAIKDKNFNGCFIADFDPEWQLELAEMAEITKKEPERIHNAQEYENLKKRVGENIAAMCKKMRIYWLTEILTNPMPNYFPDNPPPALRPPSGPQALPHPEFNLPVPVDVDSKEEGQKIERFEKSVPEMESQKIPNLDNGKKLQQEPFAIPKRLPNVRPPLPERRVFNFETYAVPERLPDIHPVLARRRK